MSREIVAFTRDAYLKPVSSAANHHPSGLYGRIVGVNYVTSLKDYQAGGQGLLCYTLAWGDYKPRFVSGYDENKVEYVPMQDIENGHYKVVSEQTVR